MSARHLFEQHEDEFLKFDRIENKLSKRPDVHAFMLLDRLFPCEDKQDIIACAEHDEYWINIDGELIEKLTEDQIIELLRCGILYDANIESLHSFA